MMKKIGLLVLGLFLMAHQALANDLSSFAGNWVHKDRNGLTEKMKITYDYDHGLLRILKDSPIGENLDILSKGEIVNDKWRVIFSSQSSGIGNLLISAVYDFPREEYAQSVVWTDLKLLENSKKLRVQSAFFRHEIMRGIVPVIQEMIYERE